MYKTLAIGLLLTLISGCGYAIGSHKFLPTADLVGPKQLQSYEDVTLLQGDARPKVGCVRTAVIAANGNGYATREDLESTLRKETYNVEADMVVVGQATSSFMQVGTYGGGLALGQSIEYPRLMGVACRTGAVWHGIVLAANGKWSVQYVRPGSPAEKADIHEGDDIVTVNGIYLGDDEAAWDREINAKPPRTTVDVGLVRDGKKIKVAMVLEAPKN